MICHGMKTEELQAAWDVIAKYMNNHEELTFFVEPWDLRGKDRYTLVFLDDNEKYVEIVSASERRRKG